MKALSNMLGMGGASNGAAAAASQAPVASSAAVTNQLQLVGASSDQIFKDSSSTPGGVATTVGEALKSSETKLLMLYFSMHNCKPCQEFTPLLVELYEEHNESNKVFEVVFFSGDKE